VGRVLRSVISVTAAMQGFVLTAFVAALAAASPQGAECGSSPRECAALLVERGDFGAAIRTLEPLLARQPHDVRALNLLGIALTAAGRTDEAAGRFREALELQPGFVPARKNLGVAEFNRGRLAEARSLFEKVLEQAPGDEVAHLHLAEIRFRDGRLGEAARHYERAGARVFDSPEWTLRYASSLLDRGETAKAAAAFDRLPPGDGTRRFEAGVALGRAGAHAESARLFASARATYRDAYAAAYNQVLMLIEAGDQAAAIRAGEDLLGQGLQPAELHNLLSRAYLQAGRVKDAYDALRTATRLEPAAEENYVDLAMICLDHENYDLGLEIVDVGLHHRPDSSILHLQRGVLLAMKAEWGEVEKEFEAARRLAPDHAAPYAALAMIWMQTGQTDKAVEVLRPEASRRGDHVVPYVFAVALMRSGVAPESEQAGEAIAALRASIRAEPDFAPARTELGRLLLRRDDADGAIQELERAVALDATSAAALYNLAQGYRKKGDAAGAAEMLSRLRRLSAQDHDDADQELQRAVVRIVREGQPRPRPGPGP
jgi:Flp pilus assembly protein TadD